ncbi:nitrate reductase [Symmachiella dynata]|uniref:molybdopterin oxidoreductase family protein n=1 Tax=Symmachiella dynata TaxID=2527995 RepID=UPI0030EE4340
MSTTADPTRMDQLQSLLHQRTGPLTRELLLKPGEFGLGKVPARQLPDATTNMVCGYCSTGCGLNVHLQEGTAVALTPTTDYPVNLGMACPKGWEALTVLDSPDRATVPMLRNASGKLEPVTWDTAMQTFVERLQGIQKQHGAESVAFLSTGQIPTEEMALLGALTKFGMGIVHGDGNTRQCMATAVVAYKQAFGFDAPPYTYADFEESDVIVLIGSNICIAHPIMWERVMRNPHDPEIIVVDPRMTETAMNASLHLALAPKSDQTLLYGIARILIEKNWVDHDYIDQHTTDFHEFREYVAQFSLERVACDTGLSEQQIQRFAELIHEGKRVSFWWTMGVNQSHQGVRTAQAIINLALMTGNIGRPGTGANSITGQANAMGSRLFSNTTNLLGGHDFANPEHREKIAGILGIDSEVIPTQNSWAYDEIIEGILRGKIKGLWVICTNPAHSWINQTQCRDILDRLDFLVVQDMYGNTETVQMADLVLPAAGWGEKEGTQINSERRIGLVKKLRPAPGQALADFSIFKLVAEYWGCGDMFAQWESPEAVFQLLKECSRGTPCDFSGIDDYEMIDKAGGIQWPYPEKRADNAGERRLFADGEFFHADGKAKFLFEDPRPLTEKPTQRYPFILLTGRGTVAQWHTQTRTRQSAVLRKLYPENPFVEINPADARALNIRRGEWTIVESQRGRLRAKAMVTHAIKAGQLFIPMHYEPTNRLTDPVFDPYSRQPSYKSCAVNISREGF